MWHQHLFVNLISLFLQSRPVQKTICHYVTFRIPSVINVIHTAIIYQLFYYFLVLRSVCLLLDVFENYIPFNVLKYQVEFVKHPTDIILAQMVQENN